VPVIARAANCGDHYCAVNAERVVFANEINYLTSGHHSDATSLEFQLRNIIILSMNCSTLCNSRESNRDVNRLLSNCHVIYIYL
jgi:hypothetical protein